MSSNLWRPQEPLSCPNPLRSKRASLPKARMACRHLSLGIGNPEVLVLPITSPVLRISGVRTIGDPGKRLKGNTDSLIAQCLGIISSVNPMSLSFAPAMTRAPSLAKGTPIALLTKGTVGKHAG